MSASKRHDEDDVDHSLQEALGMSEEVPEGESPTKLNPRQILEQRKQKLRQDEEANFTYRPALSTGHRGRTRDAPSSADENRFDKLYSDALKRHLSTTWKADQTEKDCSFAPKLIARGRSSSRGSSTSRSSSKERAEPFHERLSTLSPKKTPDEQQKELTFRPQISKRAKSIERTELKDPAERLYHHNKFLQEKKERQKTAAELREIESCTFAPSLVTRKQPAAGDKDDALLERMHRYEEARSKHLEAFQKEREEAEKSNLTFQPHLPAKKRAVTTPDKPVHERLNAPMERSVIEEDPNLTFKPKLTSRQRGPSPSPRGEDGNVHDRLFKDGVQKRRDNEIKMATMRESLESDLTFKPLLRTNSMRSGGGDEKAAEDKPFFSRVSQDVQNWATMKDSLNRIKEEMELKDCTFAPKLMTTATSKSKDDKPLYDRLVEEAERTRRTVEKKKVEQAERELVGATFAPELPKTSVSMVSNRRSSGSGDSQDVYSRLNNQMTSSLSRSNSLVGLESDSASVAQSSIAPSTVSASKTMPEKELDKVFERLHATPERQRGESTPAVEPKKVLMPAAEVHKLVNRLNKSFTKSDLDVLMAAEAAAAKAPLKVPGASIDRIFERISSHTTVASVSQHQAEQQTAPNAAAPPKKRAPSPAPTSPVKPSSAKRPSSAARSAKAPQDHSPKPSTRVVQVTPTPKAVTPAPTTPAAVATPPPPAKVTPKVAKTPKTPAAAATDATTPAPKAVLRGRSKGGEESTPNGGGQQQQQPALQSPVMPPAPPSTAVKSSTAKPKGKPSAAPAGKEDFLAKLESSLLMIGLDANGMPLAPAAKAAPAPVAQPVTKVADAAPPAYEQQQQQYAPLHNQQNQQQQQLVPELVQQAVTPVKAPEPAKLKAAEQQQQQQYAPLHNQQGQSQQDVPEPVEQAVESSQEQQYPSLHNQQQAYQQSPMVVNPDEEVEEPENEDDVSTPKVSPLRFHEEEEDFIETIPVVDTEGDDDTQPDEHGQEDL